MSYSDVNYLGMPSFWSEFFNDKPLIDKLYDTSLDVIADSYRSIVESSANTSIANHRLNDKISWLPIRVNLSTVITKQVGDDYYELLPIDSSITNFSFICSKPSIDRSKVVLNREDITLLRPDELSTFLGKEGIDYKVFRGPAALLAKNAFIMSKSEFSDSIERNLELETTITLKVPKIIKTTAEFSQLVNTGECLLSISILSNTYSIKAVSYIESASEIQLTLDTRLSLPLSGACNIILSTGAKIRSEALTTVYRESRLILWANNCYADYSSYQNKFSLTITSNPMSNSARLSSYSKTLRKLGLTEYSTNNLKAAIASTYGSLLLTTGEDNNEDILSIDLGTGRIISNQEVYDHLYPFSINKDLLIRSTKVLFNNNSIPVNMYLVYFGTSPRGLLLQDKISSLFSDRDIDLVGEYTNPIYKNYININNSECEVLYIGADYVVVTSQYSIDLEGQYINVVSKASGLVLYTLPANSEINLYKISDGLKKGQIAVLETPTLSTVQIGRFSNSIGIANGMYLPYKLYKTTPTRRIISEIEYDSKVGYLPIHVVGDYGIYVGEDLKFKSSSYYLFNDILKHNMYYVAYNQRYLELGLDPIAIDTIDSLFGPVGGVPIHLEYVSSVSILDINVTDQYSNSVTKELSDDLSTAEVAQEYSVGSSSMHSRYIQFIMPANITDFSSVTSITYDSVEYGFSVKNSQDNIIEVLLDQELPGTDVSKCFILGTNPDSIINVESVGGSNKLLGSWEPLVGSSRPIATLPILIANNSQGILSIGPRITVS